MSIYSSLSSVFPKVQWTGSSGIHVSVYRDGVINTPFSNRAEILYSLKSHDVGGQVYDFLTNAMPKFEWLLERETFANLFLVDIDLKLRGLPTSVSPDRVENPATGNLFHRIAVMAPYIGAVRFWAENFFGQTDIGFRFRIVKLLSDDEEVDVRAEAREREAQVIMDMEAVEETIMEVKEPPQQVMSTVSNLIHVFA